jgi:phosphohistidine phosphatase SixA
MRRLLLVVALLSLTVTELPAQASLIVLVRHGEKAKTGGDDPALSAEGQARALALAGVVAQAGIQHILVTEYRRTSETAAVVAERGQLVPVVVKVGKVKVPDHARAVAQALDALPPGSAALVVGHSNTIPHIVGELSGTPLGDLADDEYSTLFVVDRSAGSVRVLRSSYGAVRPTP